MKKVIIFLIFVLIVPTIILKVPVKNALVFEEENSEVVLAYFEMNKNENFIIQYTHSIHLSEVEEVYKILSGGNIKQEALVYEDYGIGMPSGAEGEEKFSIKDGKFHITNMNRVFPFLDVRVGKVVANHRLVVNGTIYELKDYLTPGSWVRIKYKKINTLERMGGVNIGERRHK